MDEFLSDPLIWLVAGAFVALAPAVKYRTAWLAAVALFMWADSVMPGREAALVLRAPALAALLLSGAFRFRSVRAGVRPPWPAVLIAVLATASIAYAEDRKFAALSVAMLIGLGVLAFVFVPRSVASVDGCRRAFLGLMLVLLGLVLLGLVPIGRGSEETSLVLGDRWRGFFVNPNALGSTTALVTPWLIVMAPRERGRARAAAFAAVIALVVICWLSGSRTAFGGLLIGGAIALWHRVRARLLIAVAAAGVLVGALAVSDVDLKAGRVGDMTRAETISNFSGRVELWGIGLRLAKDSPVLGHGYKGSRFVEILEEEAGGNVISVKTQGVNFHSQWVETLVDLGVPGAALLLLLLYVVGKRILAIGRGSRDPAVHGMRAALLGTHLYVVLDSFLNNWLLTPGSPPALVYWSMIGLAFRLDVLAKQEGAMLDPPAAASPLPRVMAAPA